MSKFDYLQQQLNLYTELDFHHDSTLANRLNDVQLWQKQRLQNTHAEFFAQPQHQLMAEYFLNRLYAGQDFDTLTLHMQRIINNAHAVEKVIPSSALKTGNAGVELARLSIQLDEDIAKYLLQQYPTDHPIDDEIMRLAYIECDQAAMRYHQMELLEILGEMLDKYVRSRMIKTAFKLAKGVAYRYRVDAIYDFIDQGFKAMEPLDSAQQFVTTFTSKEYQIIEAVHTHQPNPFQQ